MNLLKLAVIGGGHLGRIHTRLAGNLSNTELVAVVEPDPDTGSRLNEEFGCRVVSNVGNISGQFDAAIIASPTHTHFQIAKNLLNQGCHLLIEKPVTTTAAEADQLIAASDRHDLVLQVGHVERFNPAFEQAVKVLPRARYLEARRMSGYTFRSIDVGVVHDLMIHDIDLVCSLIPSPLVDTRAVGIAVFGPHEDIAQARLEFADGSVANLTASRCSFQPDRSISWFSESGFVSADLAAAKLTAVNRGSINPDTQRDVADLDEVTREQVRERLFDNVLPKQMHEVESQNAIQLEQQDFVDAIRNSRLPRVSGRDGRRAVSIAQSILDSIAHHRWQEGHSQLMGHQASPIKLLPVNPGRLAG